MIYSWEEKDKNRYRQLKIDEFRKLNDEKHFVDQR